MSYMAAHNRVRRVRGSARKYLCVTCGERASEWAFRENSLGRIVDELGRRYSRDVNDYQPMCYRCHRILDKSSITHCPQGHPYEGRNVLMDSGKRKCRTCVYARNRKRKPNAQQQARRTELQRERRRLRREVAA